MIEIENIIEIENTIEIENRNSTSNICTCSSSRFNWNVDASQLCYLRPTRARTVDNPVTLNVSA